MAAITGSDHTRGRRIRNVNQFLSYQKHHFSTQGKRCFLGLFPVSYSDIDMGCLAAGSSAHAGNAPCHKSRSDIITACITVDIKYFSAEVQAIFHFGSHRFRVDFLY